MAGFSRYKKGLQFSVIDIFGDGDEKNQVAASNNKNDSKFVPEQTI